MEPQTTSKYHKAILTKPWVAKPICLSIQLDYTDPMGEESKYGGRRGHQRSLAQDLSSDLLYVIDTTIHSSYRHHHPI